MSVTRPPALPDVVRLVPFPGRARLATGLVLVAASLGLGLVATPAMAATTPPHVTAPAPRVHPKPALPYQQAVTVGYSRKGRAITAYQVGDPAATTTVLLIGQLHGDEKWGVTVANTLVNDRRGVAGVKMWVIPSANPDGYAANTRKNAAGVDINRNFPTQWGAGSPSSGTYGGPHAASEPETRALMAFIGRVRPRRTIVLHQPLYGVNSSTKDPALATALSRNLGLPIKDFNCSGTCYGTFTQWINATTSGSGITVEAGASPGATWTTVTVPLGIVRAVGGTYS